MGPGETAAVRIESLDLSLFDAIPSQSSPGDRQAWLAVQRSFRRRSSYVYLEIGSHLGGSIQQHVVDPQCEKIISIDKRPHSQPDDRGQHFVYDGNSTVRMMENLQRVAPGQLDKIECFDSDASDIDTRNVPVADFCFIDGEHTATAVKSDFAFCLRVCAPHAAICFHDDNVIAPALREILADLRRQKVPFTARKLTGGTFGIFLRDCPAIQDEYITTHSESGRAWLRNLWLMERLRPWIPASLKPVARWLKGWLPRRQVTA